MQLLDDVWALVTVALVCAGLYAAVRVGRRSDVALPDTSSIKHVPDEDSQPEDTRLPRNFDQWIYVRHVAAATALEEDFDVASRYPNLYVPPERYGDFLISGAYPEGTIAFKDLSWPNIDGRLALTNRGCRICFTPNQPDDADIRIKNRRQFSDTGGWGYFRFDAQKISTRQTTRA